MKNLPLFAPCAFACIAVMVVAYACTNAQGLLPRIGTVFFVEPFYGAAPGGPWRMLAFVTWLALAGLIAKPKKPEHCVRVACLVLFPAVAIGLFNCVFEVAAPPALEPTAVVALVGALFYEISLACKWTRLTMVCVSFAACSGYGLATALGLWGTAVAAAAMITVQMVWSGIEMNVFRLTSASRDRESEYR